MHADGCSSTRSPSRETFPQSYSPALRASRDRSPSARLMSVDRVLCSPCHLRPAVEQERCRCKGRVHQGPCAADAASIGSELPPLEPPVASSVLEHLVTDVLAELA